MTIKSAAQLVEEHALTLRESLKGGMGTYLLTLLCLILCSCAQTEGMNTYKKDVTLWYEAFNKKNPALLDSILSENWVDIPAAPGQPPGREGAKHILVELTTTFPDLKVMIEEVLQEGNKVIVRSTITGTQSVPFMGFPAKNRTMTMQAVDIHELESGEFL